MAVELEALRLGRCLQPVEMRRRDRRSRRRDRTASFLQGRAIAPFIVGARDKGQAPAIARLQRAVPKPRAMIIKATLLLAAAMRSLCRRRLRPADRSQGPGADRPHPQGDAADRRPQRHRRAAARELQAQASRASRAAPTGVEPQPLMTDMARLHAGPRRRAVLVGLHPRPTITGDAAIRETLEQIDIVKRLVDAYPNDLELALHRRRRRPHPQGRAGSPR